MNKHKLWLNKEELGIRAELRGIDLRYADLRYVDLRYADLYDANLYGANLNWTNTQDIKGINIISIQFNTTRKNNKLSYWVELGIWTTGCFQGNEQELRKSIEEKHGNSKLGLRYLSAIDYMKSLVD